MTEEYIQVLTTVDKEELARTIASALVEKRLAGCVQIVGPATSIYRWENKVETATEWLCIIKSKRSLYRELEQAIRDMHPYRVPEIMATPVVAGSEAYLKWLDGELKKT